MTNVNVLIKGEEYKGKYVALRDFDDTEIVGFGISPEEAYKKAELNGCHGPVILFAPLKDITQIY